MIPSRGPRRVRPAGDRDHQEQLPVTPEVGTVDEVRWLKLMEKLGPRSWNIKCRAARRPRACGQIGPTTALEKSRIVVK